jgi:NTE family protein
MALHDKNVALVLSSGGARGFAHIGVIKVLEKEGYKITSVAGTSMGALVGGIYATGQLANFEEWICSLDIKEVLRLTDLSISNKGLVKGKKIIEKMKEIVPERNIEDLDIPFCAVATDILNGNEKIFTRGKLYDAIRASISIPTVFQPFQIGENHYVDGGVLNPIPINRITRRENDLLVVVDVNSLIPFEREPAVEDNTIYKKYFRQLKIIQNKQNSVIPRNKKDEISLFNLTNKSISLMLHQISALTLKNYKPDLSINISKESFGTYDFYKAREIIREGESAARKALEGVFTQYRFQD